MIPSLQSSSPSLGHASPGHVTSQPSYLGPLHLIMTPPAFCLCLLSKQGSCSTSGPGTGDRPSSSDTGHAHPWPPCPQGAWRQVLPPGPPLVLGPFPPISSWPFLEAKLILTLEHFPHKSQGHTHPAPRGHHRQGCGCSPRNVDGDHAMSCWWREFTSRKKVLANLPPDLEGAFLPTADALAIRRHSEFPGG